MGGPAGTRDSFAGGALAGWAVRVCILAVVLAVVAWAGEARADVDPACKIHPFKVLEAPSELPDGNHDAWQHYSTKSYRQKRAGWTLFFMGSAFKLVGTGFMVLSALAIDDVTVPSIYMLVGASLMPLGFGAHVASFTLLGKAWEYENTACKLSKGAVLPDQVYEKTAPHLDTASVQRKMTAGAVLTTTSLATLAAAWLAYGVWGGWQSSSGAVTWTILLPVTSAIQMVGMPMPLTYHTRMRRQEGLGGKDSLSSGGWSMFTIMILSTTLYWGFSIPIFGILHGVTAIAGGVIALVAANRTRKWAMDEGLDESTGGTVVPWVTGIRGGAILGVAGTF